MWLPVTPLCKPFVNPSAGSHSGGFMCKQGKLDGQIPTTVQVGQLYLVSSILNSLCVTCLHTHTHTCTHTHTHTCTHTRAHTHTLVGCCVLLFRYIFVWPTCVDVHLLLCAHTHTYTHTHTHTMEASIIKSCVGKWRVAFLTTYTHLCLKQCVLMCLCSAYIHTHKHAHTMEVANLQELR